MEKIQIIVGSMLGGTEYVAEAVSAVLEENNIPSDLHFSPEFAQIPKNNARWIICTSTHGAGDYPDNIKPFIDQLENYQSDLSTITYLVIGVGDTSYDTYCQAAKNTINTLNSKGCKEITDALFIDMQAEIDPEDEAEIYIRSVIPKF